MVIAELFQYEMIVLSSLKSTIYKNSMWQIL